jgi:predicted Rossmann fold nucleotide-binding protein DprA/Smf involved in DNA uptake
MTERIAIIGSRGWTDRDAIVQFVDSLPAGTVVVSGGALGADSIAEHAAHARGLAVVVHLPDYRKHGGRAPLERNKLIVADADRVVAFHDGKSTGTLHTLGLARRAGKPVDVRCP